MKIRCRKCKYVFTVESARHCPECGNPFVVPGKTKSRTATSTQSARRPAEPANGQPGEINGDADAEFIEFACPSCTQTLEAPGEMADEAIDCPSCGQSLVVPSVAPGTKRGLPELERPPETHATPPPKSIFGRLLLGTLGLIFVLVGFLIITFAIALVGGGDIAPIIIGAVYALVMTLVGLKPARKKRSTGKGPGWLFLIFTGLAPGLIVVMGWEIFLTAIGTAQSETAERKKRPTSITVICIIGFIGAVFALAMIFSPRAQQIGSWYPPYLAFSAIIGLVCMLGLWTMRKWAALTYTGFVLINQVVLLVMGAWNIIALLVPAIAILFIMKHVSQMR